MGRYFTPDTVLREQTKVGHEISSIVACLFFPVCI